MVLPEVALPLLDGLAGVLLLEEVLLDAVLVEAGVDGGGGGGGGSVTRSPKL